MSHSLFSALFLLNSLSLSQTDAAIAMLRRALINVHVDSTPAADAVKDALSEFERAN